MGVAVGGLAPPAPVKPTVYHPGVSHGHTACGKWADIQANPNSGFTESAACKICTPRQLVDWAIRMEFGSKPIALAHLNYYLAGTASDYVEDTNIENWIKTDAGIQTKLVKSFPSTPSGVFTGSFKVEQVDYDDQDYRYAFGAIDILDFEVDFGKGTIHVWFQDFYEWHPVYPGLYVAMAGDAARETNCVHAALVELKSSGAADFWMKGEATVPLSVVTAGAAKKASGSDY